VVDRRPQPGDEMSGPGPAEVVDTAAVDADAAVVNPTAVVLADKVNRQIREARRHDCI